MTTIEQTINELLARFSACATYAEYVPLRSRCVQALDSYETGAGVGPNRIHQWTRFERIDAEKRAMVKAEYNAIPVLSLAELCADQPVNLLDAVNQFRKEAATVPLTLDVVTDFICALVAASSLDPVREGSDQLEAAE